jgi:DNA repair protein RadC
MKEIRRPTPMFEIRKRKDYVFPTIKINSSRKAAEYARTLYEDSGSIEVYESFYVIAMNRASHTTGIIEVSRGGINATVVDIRLIAKFAIDLLASSLILVHNHPSGNLKPSEHDEQLTKKVISAFKLLDITVIDHLILTSEEYFSFADEGLM